MNNGSILIYEKHGGQEEAQNAFGWTPKAGNAPVQFESSATVDREGITTATEDGGFKKVGDLTVYPNEKPDYSKVEVGSKVDVTTAEGDDIEAFVQEVQPKGAFNGAIILSRKNA